MALPLTRTYVARDFTTRPLLRSGTKVTMDPPLTQDDIVKPPLLMRLLPLIFIVLFAVMMIAMFTTGQRSLGSSPYMLMSMSGMAMGVMSMFLFGGSGGTSMAEVNMARRDFKVQLREKGRIVDAQAEEIHRTLIASFPNPLTLLSRIGTPMMWQTTRARRDTAYKGAAKESGLKEVYWMHARVGVGSTRLYPLIQEQALQVLENLEPVSAGAYVRFLATKKIITNVPTAIPLNTQPAYAFRGDVDKRLPLLRAMICSLALSHDPRELGIGVITSRPEEWEWMKYLPHNNDTDMGGSVWPRLAWPSLGMWAEDWKQPIADRRAEAGKFAGRNIVMIVDTPDADMVWPAGLDQPPVTGVPGVHFIGARFSSDRMTTEDARWNVSTDSTFSVLRDQKVARLARVDQMDLVEAKVFARALGQHLPPGFGTTNKVEDTSSQATALPDFFEVLGIDDIDEYDPRTEWDANAWSETFKAPMGFVNRGDGPTPQLQYIDIVETSRDGGMGPHGAGQGQSGSGKSFLIRSIVLPMMCRYGPDKLVFVLMDFKGGSTFLGFDDVPHVLANISNLKDSEDLVVRASKVIEGEIEHRETLLKRSGAKDILEYRKLYRKHIEQCRREGVEPSMEVMPDVVILADEFRELMAQKREYLQMFVRISAVGRSLGMHLMLFSQFIDQSLMGNAMNEMHYRISLTVENAGYSTGMLGKPDAANLKKGSGDALFRYTAEDKSQVLAQFRAFNVEKPYQRRTRIVEGDVENVNDEPLTGNPEATHLQDFDLIGPHSRDAVPIEEVEQVEQVTVEDTGIPMDKALLARLRDLRNVIPAPRAWWMPPLNDLFTVESMDIEQQPANTLRLRIGDQDDPFNHRRIPFIVDLSTSGENAIVIGANKMGKSTVVETMVAVSAHTYGPREVSWYLIDYGGAKLSEVENYPNVGGYATRSDETRWNRFLGEFNTVLATRQREMARRRCGSFEEYLASRADNPVVGDEYGRMVLVIDGYMNLVEDFEDYKMGLPIRELLRNGPNAGLHVVITVPSMQGFSHTMMQFFTQRVMLSVDDVSQNMPPSDHSISSLREAMNAIPATQPGRSVDLNTLLSARVALPRYGELDPLGDGEGADIAYYRNNEHGTYIRDLGENLGMAFPDRAPVIAEVPEVVPMEHVVTACRQLNPPERKRGQTYIPLGTDMTTGLLASLEPGVTDLIIAGEQKSGRTTVLRSIISAITDTYTSSEAKFYIIDSGMGLIGEKNDLVARGYMREENYAVQIDQGAEVAARLAEVIQRRLPKDARALTYEMVEDRSWYSGPELFLIVDDMEKVSGPSFQSANCLVDLEPVWAARSDIGVYGIVAMNAGQVSSMLSNNKVIKAMQQRNDRELLLSGPRSLGAVMGNGGPKFAERRPGRGVLFNSTSMQQQDIQVGFTAPAARR